MLEIIAPALKTLSGLEVPARFWWDTPAELIEMYDYLTAPIDGFPMWRQIKFNPHICSNLKVK